VNAAVNAALQPLARSRAAQGAGQEAAQAALGFVRGVLELRGGRALLPDAPATLAAAVDAPSAELRRLVRAMPLPRSAWPCRTAWGLAVKSHGVAGSMRRCFWRD
jgi:hypothetical protein